jgi:hypothetical protein
MILERKIEDPETNLIAIGLIVLCRDMLGSVLHSRAAAIIRLHLYEDLTFKEIGSMFGIGGARASHIYRRGLRTLRGCANHTAVLYRKELQEYWKFNVYDRVRLENLENAKASTTHARRISAQYNHEMASYYSAVFAERAWEKGIENVGV